MNFKKLTVIGASLVIIVTAYRCLDFFPHTYMWLTHSPKEYMGNMEPKFPSWFSVVFGDLVGPDINHNGIRDDVEIYMNREFKELGDSDKAIIYNYAIRMQNVMKYPLGHEYKEAFWVERKYMWDCIFILGGHKFGTDGDRYQDFLDNGISYINDKTLNTFRKLRKESSFMNQFHMRSNGDDEHLHRILNLEDVCHFNSKISNEIRKKHFIEQAKDYKDMKRYFYQMYEKKYGKNKRHLYERYMN
ncbi:hypothetical protein A9Q84_15385 [Halobacteriovorax marinus]|uniref:Uncharacterized protein n=1 Tax=Halobacteriovorax marinus TaxID=97084 RepID=A0A1Y5F5D6_9BACT|nr:hypothetical protein A9Q84_15385 [Halobacteriovorax marinus]